MRSNRYSLSRLNKRLQKGTIGNVVIGGVTRDGFVPNGYFWAGSYSMDITRPDYYDGPFLDTVKLVLVVRHDELKVGDLISYQGKAYEALAVSGDDELNAYDLVTFSVDKDVKYIPTSTTTTTKARP